MNFLCVELKLRWQIVCVKVNLVVMACNTQPGRRVRENLSQMSEKKIESFISWDFRHKRTFLTGSPHKKKEGIISNTIFSWKFWTHNFSKLISFDKLEKSVSLSLLLSSYVLIGRDGTFQIIVWKCQLNSWTFHFYKQNLTWHCWKCCYTIFQMRILHSENFTCGQHLLFLFTIHPAAWKAK